MANPPTYPSDGRLTTLQNFTGSFTGGELFEVVSPGNASLGVNYNITTQLLANQLAGLSTTILTVPKGGTNTSVLGTGLLLGNGTAAVSFVPATTANLLLTSQGSTSPPAWAAFTTADFAAQSPNTVLAGPASGVATAAPAFRALVPLDLPGLVRNAVASSYTVATTDINKLIGLSVASTGLPFVLSLTAASNYTSSFITTVYNESTTRGWAIAPNGVATFILWPLQTVQIFNDNNNWKLSPNTQQWVIPNNTTFNVDNVNGTNSVANDGLGAQGTNGCFVTAQNAISVLQTMAGAQYGGVVNIQMPPVTSTAIVEQLLFNGAMPPGVSSLNFLGNTSTASNCQWQLTNGATAISLTDYQSVTVNGFGFSCAGTGSATFIGSGQYCIVDIRNNNFGANGSGVAIKGDVGAKINVLPGNTISGGCGQFLQLLRRANVAANSPINVVGTSNIGIFANINIGALLDVTNLSFTGNTTGLSGQQFLVRDGGIITGDSGVSWPVGMSAGTTSTGGLSDAGLTNSALAQMNASTLKGNNTNALGAPIDLTGSQVAGITEQGLTLLNVVQANGSISMQDTSSFSAAYNSYLVIVDNILPNTSSVSVQGLFQLAGAFQTATYVNSAGGATTYMDLIGGGLTNIATTAGYGYSAQFSIPNVNSTASFKYLYARMNVYFNSAGAIESGNNIGGVWNGTTNVAVTGLKIQLSSGTMTGDMLIYGYRTAL
jgi:hypothetical protein